MKRANDLKSSVILAVIGIVPVIWLALLIAPYADGGLVAMLSEFPKLMERPLHIQWCSDSPRVIGACLLAYGMAIGIYFSSRRNYRRGEEHDSAKWGSASALNKKYRDKREFQNKILTQNVRIGLDGKKHRRNLNVLVCGGKYVAGSAHLLSEIRSTAKRAEFPNGHETAASRRRKRGRREILSFRGFCLKIIIFFRCGAIGIEVSLVISV